MTARAERSLPNLLFVFLDELRADVLGCDGHPFVRTPTIDRLAEEGVYFSQHFTNSPLCVPARTAMLSSLYPHQTGVMSNIDQSDLGYGLGRYLTFNDDLRSLGYESIVNVGKVHVPGEGENVQGPERYRGWKTAGFDEQIPVSDALGADPHRLPKGMDETEAIRGPGESEGLRSIVGGTHPGTPGETVTGRALDAARGYLEADPPEPWALRLSINRPHTPVLPPAPYDELYADQVSLPAFDPSELDHRPSPLRRWHEMRGVDKLSADELRRLRQHYFGLVTFIDDQLNRLLTGINDRLGDDTLIVFTSDHGSSLGDHGQLTKGPYDSADITRVPLIIHWPGRIESAADYEGLSQIIDILPTMVELLGGTPSDRYEGRSLMPVLDGDQNELHESIFIEGSFPSVHPGPRETVRTLDWRYTRYPELDEDELIDLREEPPETSDVSDRYPDQVDRFRDSIDEWLARTPPVSELR